jgi:hypothetical protein
MKLTDGLAFAGKHDSYDILKLQHVIGLPHARLRGMHISSGLFKVALAASFIGSPLFAGNDTNYTYLALGDSVAFGLDIRLLGRVYPYHLPLLSLDIPKRLPVMSTGCNPRKR